MPGQKAAIRGRTSLSVLLPLIKISAGGQNLTRTSRPRRVAARCRESTHHKTQLQTWRYSVQSLHHTITPSAPSPHSSFACFSLPNFLMSSLICFRYWEFWSLGGLENLYNIVRISESPNLPAAKANIKVILSSFTFLREVRATS